MTKLRLVGGTDTDPPPSMHPVRRLEPPKPMPTHDAAFPTHRQPWSDAAMERLAELVEPTHELFEAYKEAERKYRRAMQDIADRVGVPVIRIAKRVSIIRSKRSANYEPRSDDEWSSLM
jgi:hypothetical protein